MAAHAAHAAIDHYVGDETDSPAEQSENMPEERERRFWVRFVLYIINEKLVFRVLWPTLLVRWLVAFLETKIQHQLKTCLKKDNDDSG